MSTKTNHFFCSDFTIYTTQAQVEEKGKQIIHTGFLFKSKPFVLIQEQNDRQHHEHDSLHVGDEIHEEIYAKKSR